MIKGQHFEENKIHVSTKNKNISWMLRYPGDPVEKLEKESSARKSTE